MSLPAFARCLRQPCVLDAIERDRIALALNEHLLQHDQDFPIPYLH